MDQIGLDESVVNEVDKSRASSEEEFISDEEIEKEFGNFETKGNRYGI